MWLYPCKQGYVDIVADMHMGIMPCDSEGWGWGDASTSQGIPLVTK